MTSTIEEGLTRTGRHRHQRNWTVADPRAAMLIVHGINEHSGRYEHVGDFFTKAGIDVASFDLPGHGRSGGRRGHVETFDDILDDVEDLLEQRRSLGVPVMLLGHSLGGLISATYVVRGRPAPDLLVLSSPALTAQIPGPLRAVTPLLDRLVPWLPVPNKVEGTVLSRDEQVGARYHGDPLLVTTTSARMGNQIFRAMADTTAKVDRITVPTYVLHGAEDALVPPSASAPLEALPNVTRVVHDDLRHECFNEPEQDDVMAGVVAWIDAQLADLPGA